MLRQSRCSALLAVDNAERLVNHRTAFSQVSGRKRDLPAGGDDVLDDEHAAARDVGALGKLSRAVGLGGLPHEHDRQTGLQRERVATGTPPSSKPASTSVPGGIWSAASSAIARSSIGSDSKRYLSKYSLAVRPDLSWNTPTRCEVV
jgi:hypothetical protein